MTRLTSWLEYLKVGVHGRALVFALCFGCCWLTVAPRAFAQLGTGTLTGEVRDASN